MKAQVKAIQSSIIKLNRRGKNMGYWDTFLGIFKYYRHYKDFPKYYGQNINKIKWVFRLFNSYSNACSAFYDAELDTLLLFVPEQVGYFFLQKDGTILHEDILSNKVIFAKHLWENDIPCITPLFWKEDDKFYYWSNETNEMYQDVIEKPIVGTHGYKIKKHKKYWANSAKEGFLYQKIIENHQKIKELVGVDALNTVRIITYLTDKGEVEILSTYLRLSTNGVTDNLHAGGIRVGVDIKKGILNETGSDIGGNLYYYHPIGKTPFKGFSLPRWDEAISIVKKASCILSKFRFVGWDIAICSNGVYVLEANKTPYLEGSQMSGTLLFNTSFIRDNIPKHRHNKL